jgi:hypothetical protein
MLDSPPLDAALSLIANSAIPAKITRVALRKLSASLARKDAVECRKADLPPRSTLVGHAVE